MVDKLDLEVPRAIPFRPAFKRAWDGPESDKIFKKVNGGLYEVSGDLRGVGIPAKLSLGHKHHRKLGPKLEVIGAGELTFSAWADVHNQVFEGEAWENEILRVDLTGDVKSVPVGFFERAMWCEYKHTNQQEYGEPDDHTRDERLVMARAFARFDAQTLYYGRKPRQVRFYDKTRHRLKVLLPAINRKLKDAGLEPVSFFDVYGYEPHEIVTRAERQMGARETATIRGLELVKFGDIHKLMHFDPFTRLRFEANAAGGLMLAELDGARAMLIEMLRERIERTGLEDARAWARSKFQRPGSFRKFWWENEHLILYQEGAGVTREAITQEHWRSLEEQLAA